MNDHYIVVLCHEVNPDGTLSTQTQSRVDFAISLYHTQPSIRLIMSGGTLGSVCLAESMMTYAKKHNVPTRDIYCEPYSLDTVGQLAFVRSGYLEPLKITKPHIVTNDYHVPRVAAFARTLLPYNIFEVTMHSITLPSTVDKEECAKSEQIIDADGLDKITRFRNMFGALPNNSNDVIDDIFSKHPVYGNAKLERQVRRWINDPYDNK